MRLFKRKKKSDSYVQEVENIIIEGFKLQEAKAKASGLTVDEVQSFFRAANDANVKLVETMLVAAPMLGTYIDQLGKSALSEVAYADGSKDNPSRIAIAKLLLEAGANVNAPVNSVNPPLFAAIHRNNLEMVRFLVKHGADIRFKNDAGVEPIHLCADIGKVKIIKFLLECGADINVRDGINGKTLLGRLYTDRGISEHLVADVIEFVKSAGGIV